MAGRWCSRHRAADQVGQLVDVRAAERQDRAVARWLVTRARAPAPRPGAVATDQASAYPRVLAKLLLAAQQGVQRSATQPLEADPGGVPAQRQPKRSLPRLPAAAVAAAGQAFGQNIRRGPHDLAVHLAPKHRLPADFTDLARTV